MAQQFNSAFDGPPSGNGAPSAGGSANLGHWIVLAIVFFSGPIFWAVGNVVEATLYMPGGVYQYTGIVDPMTQDRIARYWPWAVRVTLGINVLIAFAAFLIIRQDGDAREGQPHSRETRSIEDWLIKISGTVASALVVVFFWASFAAVAYLIVKNMIL